MGKENPNLNDVNKKETETQKENDVNKIIN